MMETKDSNGAGPNLSSLHVQEVVRSAESELTALLKQRADLMKRIGTIKQTVAGLADMFGESLLSESLLTMLDRKSARQGGFTKACRTVLMDSPAALTVRQVCEHLRKKFPGTLERHKKPYASVTTVLARLVEYDEARTFIGAEGQRAWEWVAERAVASEFLPATNGRAFPSETMAQA